MSRIAIGWEEGFYHLVTVAFTLYRSLLLSSSVRNRCLLPGLTRSRCPPSFSPGLAERRFAQAYLQGESSHGPIPGVIRI